MTIPADSRYFNVLEIFYPLGYLSAVAAVSLVCFLFFSGRGRFAGQVKSERLKELRGLNKAFAIMDPEVRHTPCS